MKPAYRLIPNEIPCPMCTQTVDMLGDHAACCTRNGERIVRHNRVRNLVANICREGLLSPVVEMKNLLTSTARRPGDIVLPNWSNGRPLAVDVAVTSPFTINGMK